MQFIPYPTDPDDERELLEYLARLIIDRAADEMDATPPVFEIRDDEKQRLQNIARAAADLVTNYLGKNNQCPQSVKNEAAIRAIGWMANRASDGRISEKGWSGVSRDYNTAGCLRGSGAMNLLAPYKIRRAGAISHV